MKKNQKQRNKKLKKMASEVWSTKKLKKSKFHIILRSRLIHVEANEEEIYLPKTEIYE